MDTTSNPRYVEVGNRVKPPMEKPMSKNKTLNLYLLKIAKKYKIYLSGLVIIAVFSGLFNIFFNYQIKKIIDAITLNPNTNVFFLCILFILYKLSFHGVYFIRRLFDIKYSPIILAEVVENIYSKTMQHSLHWFDSHRSGEISSKIMDFQDSITTLIMIASRSLSNFSVIFVGILFLLTVNYQAAFVIITFVIIYASIMTALLKTQLRLQEEYAKARQQSIGIVNDSVSNVFSIKIIGNIWTELKLKLIPAINNWKIWDKKTRKYDAYYVDITDTLLVTLMSGAQILLLVYLYKTAQITAGSFAFIAMITLSIHRELEDLLNNILFSFNPKVATIKASFSFINDHPDVVDKNNAIILEHVSGDIKYENVQFSYGNNVNIFDGLTLHIKSGERIGIVGSSGAGKTTFIKCLLRYFNIQDGRILIDGHDIFDVTEESLRANISVIPQDITMFHRSILENLQLAKYEASFDEIQNACKKARIHEDIEKMPSGYHTVVGERGIKISGGQRQRIAIARAILKGAPILILDEATSALDTPTESLIQNSINEILETSKATTIVIAHRLSTLLHMDRILVFEQGKIIEQGTHTELLAKHGLYKTLWEAQAGGFLPDTKTT